MSPRSPLLFKYPNKYMVSITPMCDTPLTQIVLHNFVSLLMLKTSIHCIPLISQLFSKACQFLLLGPRLHHIL